MTRAPSRRWRPAWRRATRKRALSALTTYGNDCFEITRPRLPAQEYGEGDRALTFEANEQSFNIALSENHGRDRDGYDSSSDIDLDISREEALELLLLLTVWLEQTNE